MAAPSLRAPNVLKGILFMLGATLAFPFLNAAAKYLSRDYPTPEIIWARSLGHLVFAAMVFMPRRGLRLFATRHLPFQLARSLLLVSSTTFFFTALSFIPLADASAVSFTGPLMVAALAVPVLHERVGPERWLAIGAGFIGALIVIRPGAGVNHWASLLVLGSALCYAVYQVLTRIVGAADSAETSVSYSALVGTVVFCAVVPFFWRTPQDLGALALFCALGLFGGLGHYFVACAYQWGPASVLSPFNYAQLIGAVTLGYLIFGDVPSLWTWLGSALIVASGLHIAYRERKPRLPARIAGK
jgi:drug/metabolite transporter (DMT)-like permease